MHTYYCFYYCWLATKLCLTLCYPMDCTRPGSSVRGIFQAGILKWAPFSSPGEFLTQGSNLGLLHWQMDSLPLSLQGSPTVQVALVVKNPPDNAGGVRDTGLIPGWGRSPGGGHGNPLHYSYLENSMDRGAWRATVHRVAKRRV